MIKVIHFMPSINITSGIAQMVMNYYRIIDRNKIQFDFVYFIEKSNENFECEIRRLGGNIIKVCSPTNYFKFYNEINSLLTSYKEDIIFHNHQISFAVFLEPILKKAKIKRSIVHNHMTKYSDKIMSSIRNRVLCYPIRFFNLEYFACSYDAANFMYGTKKTKNGEVFIMDNGINCKKYLFDEVSRNNIRTELQLEDKYVIGHIGHFNKVKNHNFIIDIFEQVSKNNSKAHLLLIGTGPLRKKIEQKAINRGIISNITILENRKDIPDLLNAMDVFVFPSLFEGLGIAAIEAQATGLPVIMSDKVPHDVKINNCQILNLNSEKNEWILAIEKAKVNNLQRKNSNEIIFNSKFNIWNLEEKYINYISEKK